MKEWKCVDTEICKAACCGSFPMDKDFLKKHEHMAQVKPVKLVSLPENLISPETEDNKCVFLNRETLKCAIYPDRPDVCREYGQVPRLPCPWVDLKGNRRSPAKVMRMARLIRKYEKEQLRYLKRIANF